MEVQEMKEKEKLNITFHNPNTGDELIKELIRISASMAHETVKKKLLALEQEEMNTYTLQNETQDNEDDEWER